MENQESLEMDAMKIEESLKRLYNLDNIVILTRQGDRLGTFSSDDAPVIRAMIEVAQKFHNQGVKSF